MPSSESRNEEAEDEKNWNMFLVRGRDKGEEIVDETNILSLAFAGVAVYIAD